MKTHGTVIDPEEQQHHHHTNLIEHEEEKEVVEAEENFEGVGTKATEVMNAGQQQPCVELDTTAIIGPSKIVDDQDACNHGCALAVEGHSDSWILNRYENVFQAALRSQRRGDL